MNKVRRDPNSFPQKDFDLIKEGTVSLVIVIVLVVVVSLIWKAPYSPAITNQQIANSNPILFEQTALNDLDGQSAMASYGPPYNNGWKGNITAAQSIGPLDPEAWWGTPYQVIPYSADVMKPLQMLATASGNTSLKQALSTYISASPAQQQSWDQNYNNALAKAKVENGKIVVPFGSYGPVALMMKDEMTMGKSGLLSGALNRETNQGVYRWNVQNDLLFLQGAPLEQIAKSRDILGGQWGINHDEVADPGPWWLTPYTFLYQIPPYNTSSAGDEMAAYTVGILFLLLVLLPFIPGLNKLPKVLPLYKVIWRDWYKRNG